MKHTQGKNARTRLIEGKLLEISLSFLLLALKEWVFISGLTCTARNRRDTDVQSYTGWELIAT